MCSLLCFSLFRLEMMSFGDRSQAAASGQPGILPAQKVPPMGLNSITGYNQTGGVGSMAGVTSSLSSSRYSTSSSQVAPPSGISTAVGYPTLTSNSHSSSYPINPDVKLKKLPFYDIMGELLKPSSLGKCCCWLQFL